MNHSARRLAVAFATATLVVTPTLAACGNGETKVEQPKDTKQEKHLTLKLGEVVMTYDHMDVSVEVTTDLDMAAVIDVSVLDDEGKALTTNTTSISARTDVHQTAKTTMPLSPDIVQKVSSIHIESPRAKNVIDDKQTIQEAKADLLGEDMRLRHILMRDMPPETTADTKSCVLGTDLFLALMAQYDGEFPEQIHLNNTYYRGADIQGKAEPSENFGNKGFIALMRLMSGQYNRILVDVGIRDLVDENEAANVEALDKALEDNKETEFIFVNNPNTPRLNEVVKAATEKHDNAYLVDWASVLTETDARVDENGMPADGVASDTLMSLMLEMLTPPKEEKRPNAEEKEKTDEATADSEKKDAAKDASDDKKGAESEKKEDAADAATNAPTDTAAEQQPAT